MFLLFLFILIPTLELYTMISVGSEIGAFKTILLVFLTAMIGGFLVRKQGMSVATKAQASLARGEQPALEIIEGFTLMIAGAMLLLPGFITDCLGFLLLIPPIRKILILSYIKTKIVSAASQSTTQQTTSQANIIEGTCKRED
jgi:UPF0716 protein FxsA